MFDDDLDDYEVAQSGAESGPMGLDLDTPELAGVESEAERQQILSTLSHASEGFNDDHYQVVSATGQGSQWELIEGHLLFHEPAQRDYHLDQHRQRYYTPAGEVNKWERTQARRRKAEERERDPDHHRRRSREAMAKQRGTNPDSQKAAQKAYRSSEKGRQARREQKRRYRERQKLLKQQQQQLDALKQEHKNESE